MTHRLIALALFALLITSFPQFADARDSFTTVFQVAGQRVQVDFQDAKNFRFVSADGTQTIVHNGAVYLAFGGDGAATNVFFVQDASARAPQPSAYEPPRASVRPVRTSNLPAELAGKWRLPAGVVHQTIFQRPGALRSTVITSAHSASFARAQQSMRTRLNAMDMSVCGASVRDLVAWWVPEMTEIGHAVIATETGIALEDPPSKLKMPSASWLPKGKEIADYRVLPQPR